MCRGGGAEHKGALLYVYQYGEKIREEGKISTQKEEKRGESEREPLKPTPVIKK